MGGDKGAPYRLFVGSYTDSGSDKGIYTVAFDAGRGEMRVVRTSGHAPNPSFVVRRGAHVYAAHELEDRGCLAAYIIGEDGALTCCGACSSPYDAGTCFVAVHPSGRCLYGANYESGSVSLCTLSADGMPSGGLPSVRHAGSGPNRARQRSAHVHSAAFVPGTCVLAVVDLGTDTVTLYRTGTTGVLEAPAAETIRVPGGSGPRMLAFHPDLPIAALVNELTCDVLLYRFDRAGLGWERIGRLELPVRPGDMRAAQPAFSPNGRHLYATVRGSDRLSMFQVDSEGRAEGRADVSSGGRGPRHFSLSPDGDFLAVANQDSDDVTMLALDPASGMPRQVASLNVSQPSCVAWA